MRLALFSDIHSNLQAFEACLAHAQAQQITHKALLGDFVGYGGQPAETLDLILQLHGEGALAITGNHDRMAVIPPTENITLGSSTAQWTHEQLRPHHFDFLRQLPLTLTLEDVLIAHGSAHEPERWRYVDSEMAARSCLDAAHKDPSITHVFVGHVHRQTLYYQGTGRGLMTFTPEPGIEVPVPKHRQWVATIGSVGQPRDGDTRAMYAIYDSEQQRLTFHRVTYDHAAAARAIRSAGLPEYFAERLESGR